MPPLLAKSVKQDDEKTKATEEGALCSCSIVLYITCYPLPPHSLPSRSPVAPSHVSAFLVLSFFLFVLPVAAAGAAAGVSAARAGAASTNGAASARARATPPAPPAADRSPPQQAEFVRGHVMFNI